MSPTSRSITQFEHPHSPVRDDAALGPTEDLDRQPDGVPHRVIGLALLGSLVLAAIVLLLLSGHASRHPGAVVALLVTIPSAIAVAIALGRAWRKPGASHPSV